MCTENEKCDGQRTVEHEADGRDAMNGINLVTMLMAKGKAPQEIMAALAMGLATFNVICVPDEAALQANTDSTDKFIRRAQVDLWEQRETLERLVKGRVARILPMALILDAVNEIGSELRSGGGDTRPKEQAEPQHEQFKV